MFVQRSGLCLYDAVVRALALATKTNQPNHEKAHAMSHQV
jgi:hypothetical protein